MHLFMTMLLRRTVEVRGDRKESKNKWRGSGSTFISPSFTGGSEHIIFINSEEAFAKTVKTEPMQDYPQDAHLHSDIFWTREACHHLAREVATEIQIF